MTVFTSAVIARKSVGRLAVTVRDAVGAEVPPLGVGATGHSMLEIVAVLVAVHPAGVAPKLSPLGMVIVTVASPAARSLGPALKTVDDTANEPLPTAFVAGTPLSVGLRFVRRTTSTLSVSMLLVDTGS